MRTRERLGGVEWTEQNIGKVTPGLSPKKPHLFPVWDQSVVQENHRISTLTSLHFNNKVRTVAYPLTDITVSWPKESLWACNLKLPVSNSLTKLHEYWKLPKVPPEIAVCHNTAWLGIDYVCFFNLNHSGCLLLLLLQTTDANCHEVVCSRLLHASTTRLLSATEVANECLPALKGAWNLIQSVCLLFFNQRNWEF